MVFYGWERIKPEEITRHYRRRVAASENITVAMVEVTAGATTLPHRHENEEATDVIVSIGGGGLAAGVATADVRIWGVETKGAESNGACLGGRARGRTARDHLHRSNARRAGRLGENTHNRPKNALRG